MTYFSYVENPKNLNLKQALNSLEGSPAPSEQLIS